MKKIFILIAVLLLLTPTFALQPGAKLNSYKSTAYKILGCSINSAMEQSFALKTICPREAFISGEDLTIELIGVDKNSGIVYAHFKAHSNNKVYEFWRSPADQAAAVGKYYISVTSAAVLSAAGIPVWGSAEFIVSTVKPWIPTLPSG